MSDTAWMKPISKQIISMHCSRNPFLPYKTDNINLPASGLTLITNASGGADVVPKANSIGLNKIINNYAYLLIQ